MADEEDWEVVNYQAKKQQKQQKRTEKKKVEAEQRLVQESAEKAQRQADTQRFLEQYQNAGNFTNTAYSESTLFSSLAGVDDDKMRKKEERKLRKKLGEKAEIGEILVFEKEAKKQQKSKNKSQNKSKQTQKVVPLTEAMKKVSTFDLQKNMAQVSQRFPNDHEVQLKSLAEQLEVALKDADTSSLDLNDPAFPMSAFNQDVVATIKKFIEKIPDAPLGNFFWFLVETLVSAVEKKSDISGLGVRLLIQIIAINRPQVFTSVVPKIAAKYATSKQLINNHLFSTFYWIFNQLSAAKSYSAVAAWLYFLLPFTQDAASSNFADQAYSYIENFLKNTKHRVGRLSDETASTYFSKLLELKYSKDLNPRMKALLPQILDRSFLLSTQDVSKPFFERLLSRAADKQTQLRDEVLNNLVGLLQVEPDYFDAWTEIYQKYIAETNNVLTYIQLGWKDKGYSKKLSGKKLAKFVNHVIANNKKLIVGKRKGPETKEIATCSATCESFKDKLGAYMDADSAKGGKKGATTAKTNESGSSAWPVLAVGIAAIGGAVYWLSQNCCQIDQCREFVLTHPNDFLKC